MNIKQVHTPEKMTSIINESLKKLKTESVTERELEKARNQIETGHIFGLQTNFVRGIRIGFSLTMTGDPLRFIKDLDKYRSTTADDIKRVAKKYFTPENRTVVRLLPKEESQDKSAR
jgi:predicted Zn-dependent peptidase